MSIKYFTAAGKLREGIHHVGEVVFQVQRERIQSVKIKNVK